MIGTHNTLTCYNSKNKIFNLFKCFWKCQKLDLNKQLTFVDYFDIRVRYDKNNNIIFCHGIVDLDVPYTLNEILDICLENKITCRIIIERNENKRILYDVSNYIKLGVVKEIIIKKNWKIIYSNEKRPIIDYTYVPFHSDKSFFENLKHLKISTIKHWAKKHNPDLQSYYIKNSVYINFVDFAKHN